MSSVRREFLKRFGLSFLTVGGALGLKLEAVKNSVEPGVRSDWTEGTYYKNVNIQRRNNPDQEFYWSVRPFGKPNPLDCLACKGIISEKIEKSDDGLVMTVTTIWETKTDFLNALPPELFEQPGFDLWHKKNNIHFSFYEEYIPRKLRG